MLNIIFSKNKIFILALLYLCTCAVSSYLGGAYYYGILMLLSSIFVISQNKKYIYKNGLFILIIAILSTIINYPSTPQIFRPINRIFTLIIVMLACAPIFNNHIIYKFRHRLFGALTIGLSIVGILSALLATRGWGYMNDTIWLIGLSDFPNALGYSLAISVMYICSSIPGAKLYLKIIYITLIFLCIWAIPLTGTRTAFYSIPIFLIIYIFLTSKNITTIIKSFFIVSSIIIIFFSFIKLDTTIIDNKNRGQTFEDNSRTTLYNARIKEFKEHPILGIGTFVADLRWTPVSANGNVETGNTFLMFLSMNGIIGFINFIIVYISLLFPYIKYILTKRRLGTITNFEIFLSAIVTYNFISMMQMGILLNPGMYITGINWLTLSLIYKPHIYLSKTSNKIFI